MILLARNALARGTDFGRRRKKGEKRRMEKRKEETVKEKEKRRRACRGRLDDATSAWHDGYERVFLRSD